LATFYTFYSSFARSSSSILLAASSIILTFFLNVTTPAIIGWLLPCVFSNPTTAGATVANFKINSANNGYEFYLVRGSASIIAAYLTVSYFAQ